MNRTSATGLLIAAVFLAGMATLAIVLRPDDGSGPPADAAPVRSTYDPVRAGEPLPDGYRPLLARDAIYPVYEPRFVPAAESGWSDDTLVIGVEFGAEARAYPVAHLNRREIVIDTVGGVPLLVSW